MASTAVGGELMEDGGVGVVIKLNTRYIFIKFFSVIAFIFLTKTTLLHIYI